MPGIRTQIELYDAISAPLMNIINSVHMSVSAMENLQATMNEPVSNAIAEGIDAQMNQAMQAIEEARAALAEPITQNNDSITWNTPNMDVFTNTGVERFQQEIQSTNAMMERLSTTQAEIASRASKTAVFPPNMVSDMGTMQTRIYGIQERISAIENNPLNLGTDLVNNELEQLRMQLNQAIEHQEDMNQAIQRMDVSEANQAYLRLSQPVDGTERYIRDNVDEQGRFNRVIRDGTSEASRLEKSIMGAVGAYATIHTVGNVMDLSDRMIQTDARLGLIVDDGGSVEELQQKIYAVAQNTRAPFMDTADMVAKLGLQASKAFSSNDELLAFAEQLNKNFVVAGTHAQGVESVMLQLTQAMAAGKLQGEELNAVLDNAQPIVASIQRYLEEVQNIDASNIKQLASDGVLTAEVIKNAMFYAADETNAKFDSMPVTFAQAWQGIQDDLLMTFQPMLETIASGATWIHDNWSTIEPIFWGLAAAVGAYTLALGSQTAATWIATGAARTFFMTLLTNPLGWIAIAIGAVIGMIYNWVQSVGGMRIAWAIVMNYLLAGWDWLKIGFFTGVYFVLDLWDKMMLGMKTAGVAIQDFMGDMKANVLMILQNMVNGAIGIINGFIDTLNKIPGVSIDVIQEVSFGTAAQLENEAAKMARHEELQNYQDEVANRLLERDEAINQMRTNAVDAFNSRKAEIEVMQAEAAAQNVQEQVDPSSFVSGNSDMDLLQAGINDIADNTAGIKDAVNVSQEDLKYMRDMAEAETINRFTTTEIKVELGGVTNNVNSNMDLDGVIDYIAENVGEALEVMAEGVHS